MVCTILGIGDIPEIRCFQVFLGMGYWDDVLLGHSDPWVASAAGGVDMSWAWAWD